MRTPCQDAPEAWVGDDNNLRAQAVRECMTCHLLEACQREAKANRPTFGVLGGFDYTPKSGRRKGTRKTAQESRDCEACGVEFFRGKISARQWASRRYCSLPCFYGARAAA